MKNIVWLCIGLLGIQQSSSAAQHQSVCERWQACWNAVNDNDIEVFKNNFTSELLNKYTLVPAGDSSSHVIPCYLIHVLINSRSASAREFVMHMVEQGFDPNEQKKTLLYQNLSNGYVTLRYFEKIENHLPLDLAVLAGNVASVKALLECGADPYRTLIDTGSSIQSWLGRLVLNRIGPNVRSLALEYAYRAQHGDVLPGTQEEYAEIAELLYDAQLREDISTSCLVQ